MRRRLLLLAAIPLFTLLPACAPEPSATPTETRALLATIPPELATALDHFRAEGPKGWAFTQTTSGGGKNRVERYDPRERGAGRWTLLLENGAMPTEAEQQRYRDTRPPLDSSSQLAAQFDRARVSLAAEDSATATYEFAIKPASDADTAAAHMRARVTLHRASGAIVRVELFNFEPFKPASSLTIEEARTTLTYAPPANGRPALPLESKMQVRGKRFWFRDFEQTVTSTFSEQQDASKPRG